MDDFRNFSRLAQTYPVLDSAGGVICEPNDTPLDSRHLDMTYALQTLTDKVYMGNVVSGVNARDTIAMTEILFGSREAIEQTPATISRRDGSASHSGVRVRKTPCPIRPLPVMTSTARWPWLNERRMKASNVARAWS